MVRMRPSVAGSPFSRLRTFTQTSTKTGYATMSSGMGPRVISLSQSRVAAGRSQHPQSSSLQPACESSAAAIEKKMRNPGRLRYTN